MKYLFGASGHAKVVVDVINSTQKDVIIGVFDDNKVIDTFLGIPFVGKLDINTKLLKNAKFLITIGDNNIRKRIVKKLDVEYFSAVDRKSLVSKTSQIGQGSVIMPNTVINANSKIGNHCIVNTSAIIEHDCVIENFVHISPNATITGNVIIGEGTHIGAGAVIIPNITIGKWCIIGAGSVVIENIPNNSIVVGNPARIIKTV